MNSLPAWVAAAALTIMLGIAGMTAYSNKSDDAVNGKQSFAAIVSRAHTIAQTSGSGATIVITAANGAVGTLASIYSGRPYEGVSMSSSPVETEVMAHSVVVSVVGVSAPLAFTIDSAGAIAPVTWAPGDGTLSEEASCATDPLPVTFAAAGSTQTAQLDCAASAVQ